MSLMTNNEKRLIELIKQYPHPNHSVEDRNGLGICIMLSGRENGWTDDFIRICEDNPNISFDEILELIFSKERFPTLEIVDNEDE